MSNAIDTETESAEEAAGGLPFETAEDWKNFYEKFGANGRTYRDFTNLTPESMEAIYMVGYNQYNAGKYEEAEKIFQLLSILNHFDKRFWTALGATRELLQKYPEAVKAFSFLAVLDMQDPLPPLLCSKCFIAMGQVDDAKSALHAAVFNAGEKPEFAEIKSQAENMLDLLERAHSEK